jgi:hypothetical protein
MITFLIKLDDDHYVTRCEITSNYLYYERTTDRAAATQLTNFGSQLVIQKLRVLGEKNPRREETWKTR